MSNGSFSNPSIEEYVPKIKIIADEMARRKHGIENDIEINEMILRDMIEQLNKKILEKAKTIKKKKASNSINKKNTKTKIPTSNSPEQNPPLTSKSNEPKENENINSRSNQGNMSKEGINAQDGNSNIISTNTNVNTNQNTYSRLNTYYNINTNNNANNNNDLNNNSNIDENNELNQSSQNKSSSNKINNSNNNESSSKINSDDNNMNENNNNNYLNIQENKYKIESINEEETSENKEVKDESEKKNENEYIEEEIVYSPSLEIDFDDSSDDTNISRSNYMNGKSKKLTLYEREIRNREVRNKILEKKREQNKINEVKGLKPHPKMDKNSKKIINNKDYIPIEERAAKIHSMKLVKQILIEEERKYQKWKEEMDAIYIRKMRTKNFNKEEWDEFVKSQYQWKDEVQYKIRAAQIFRKNVYKKYYFKPNISKKSKSIIKDIQKGNDSFIDEVYVRLFNDYEERKERQKFINENSKPSFKPKISNSSQKLLNRCEKVPNRCNSNSVMNISKINNSKNDYKNDIYDDFNKNKTRNKNRNQIKKIPKSRSQIIINDVNNNNNNINDKKSLNNKSFSAIKDKSDNDKNYLHTNNSFINQNKNNKVIKKHIENKSQGPTQPTNNTNANNYNNTEINTDLFSSKYVILENPLVRSFIDKNMDKNNFQIKPKPIVPTIPIKEKSTIENNYEGKNDIYGLSQEGQCYFDQSHYDDDEGIKKGKNRENEENEYDDDYFNVDINQNDEESTNKKLPNESLQNSHIFEKVESMNNIDKNRKYGRQTQNDTLNSDDSKLRDSNLYKLNIRESTPLMFKQDVILPSNEYSDFFNK